MTVYPRTTGQQSKQFNILKLHEISSQLNFGNTEQQVPTVHKTHSQHKYEQKSGSSTWETITYYDKQTMWNSTFPWHIVTLPVASPGFVARQRWKLCDGALAVDFRAECSSCSMTNSLVINAVLIERAVSCWHLHQLISQTTQYVDSWQSDLLQSELKMQLMELNSRRVHVPHSCWRHCSYQGCHYPRHT